MKGLAADGGLFLPEEIPIVNDWVCFLDHLPSLCGSVLWAVFLVSKTGTNSSVRLTLD